VAWLIERGWRLLARNVKVGPHDEIDIVAMDPGPPPELVCVEVRSARSSDFGSPEERIDRRKVASLYRGMRVLDLEAGMPRRVDLLVVDLRGTRPNIRHLRRLAPD
jgi:putative endonuclease